MSLERVMSWIFGVVFAFALAGKLDVLQRWIWVSEAKILYASRTSTWGSPDIFQTHKKHNMSAQRRLQLRPKFALIRQ